MAMQSSGPKAPERAAPELWYARAPQDVASAFGVDPASGLSAARVAELLAENGPNALPEEKPKPAWRRFVEQYRSYMQIVLVVAAIVSLAIAEWSTAILLVLLTLLNAIVGLRQEGKAESAMNALKSMLTATARVRRDGTESEIPAEQLVVGDVVHISAGDQVPADGRLHRGPRAADRRVGPDRRERARLEGRHDPAEGHHGPGGPVEHGVHAHPGHPWQRCRGHHRDR